jgi:hypothetical protein
MWHNMDVAPITWGGRPFCWLGLGLNGGFLARRVHRFGGSDATFAIHESWLFRAAMVRRRRRLASPRRRDAGDEPRALLLCSHDTWTEACPDSLPDAIHAMHVFTRRRHVTMASGQGMRGVVRAMACSGARYSGEGRAPNVACLAAEQQQNKKRQTCCRRRTGRVHVWFACCMAASYVGRHRFCSRACGRQCICAARTARTRGVAGKQPRAGRRGLLQRLLHRVENGGWLATGALSGALSWCS